MLIIVLDCPIIDNYKAFWSSINYIKGLICKRTIDLENSLKCHSDWEGGSRDIFTLEIILRREIIFIVLIYVR
jgi:hypothetical protein